MFCSLGQVREDGYEMRVQQTEDLRDIVVRVRRVDNELNAQRFDHSR